MKRKICNLSDDDDDDDDGGGGGWKGGDSGGGRGGWKGADSGGGGKGVDSGGGGWKGDDSGVWKGADSGGWKGGHSGGWKGGDSGGGVGLKGGDNSEGGGGWKGGDNSGGGGGWKGCDNGGTGSWKCCENAGGWKGSKNSRCGWCSGGWKGRDNGGGSGGGGDNKIGGSWKGGNIDGGWKGDNSAGGDWERGNSGGGWKGGDSEDGGWGSSATDDKKSGNQGGGGSCGSGGGWAGKNTELDTLLEKLFDSLLLMSDKVEGISNRVNKLEEKMNAEIMLGKKERTEFMNEVKSELAKLKKSQEEEQTVFVGSHLVSKLSNLQKSVESNFPVDIASTSKGWRLSTSHLDVQQPSGWDKHLDVQQPSQVYSPWNSPNQVYSYLDMSDFDRSNITPSEGHWRPPRENVRKVNVGVVVSSWGTAACGVIARDHLSEFKGCCTESLLVHSFEEAEAKAFLTGVQFAVRNGLKNVVIEGDAQNIITILNDADHAVPSHIRPVIEQIRMLAEMPLPAIEFRFIKKSGNMVAHTLASYAKSNLIDQSWETFPPPIITSLLFEESLISLSVDSWDCD